MKVVLTREARGDLKDIGDHIAQSNPVRARGFVSELMESIRGLSTMGDRFPLMLRYEGRGIRRRVHGNYLIFYRVEPDLISVLHVLHGARDYEALLFPED